MRGTCPLHDHVSIMHGSDTHHAYRPTEDVVSGERCAKDLNADNMLFEHRTFALFPVFDAVREGPDAAKDRRKQGLPFA